MNKLIKISTVLFLSLLYSNSIAEWVFIGEQENGTFFYDPKSIIKNGNERNVAELYNQIPLPDGKKLSFIMNTKYDCKLKRMTILHVKQYSDHMANGAIYKEFESPKIQWNYYNKDSIGYAIHQKIC